MKNDIILYRPDNLREHFEVRIEQETVWLNRHQMAALFGRDVKTIGKHINNVFSEGELESNTTVANFATVQNEGSRMVERQVEFYNLDVIISVGYRVKSRQGTQFRIWATNVLKEYLLKGYALNQRMNRIENTVENLAAIVKDIDQQIKTHSLPSQGVFFDGKVYDAYEFASKIIRSACKSIILIDNYVNENTLTQLSKKANNVKVLILTKSPDKQLRLDIKKAGEQYGQFELRSFDRSHDRFLVIDETEIYHLGASLKDLGKKWFAFSKLNPSSVATIMHEIDGVRKSPGNAKSSD